jgi:putative ABC transport system substrate-binding protein
MKRLALLVLGLTMLCALALAQAPGKVYRLGLLALNEQSVDITREHTLPELATLGFVAGRNLVIDSKIGNADELAAAARALVASGTDAMIAIGAEAILAARAASTTVPIVMFGDDPVSLGVAESLPRPGRNVTGVTILVAELDAKRLQLLHEAVPEARRVAGLLYAAQTNRTVSMRVMQEVAAGAALDLLLVDVPEPVDYPAAFEKLGDAGIQALVVGPTPVFFRDGERIAALALNRRMATACEWADMARAGCLIGFGPNRADLRRRMAHIVARVLSGVDPAELPIEGPTRFELGINLRTARALGIEVPPALLVRADEVIE